MMKLIAVLCLSLMLNPKYVDGQTLECGETVTGTLSDGSSNIASFIFINAISQTVTFTNCESTFDTQMRLLDSSNQDITSQSTNSCDGDDCQDSSVSCTTSTLRETFTMESLSAGTYTIQLNPWSTGGTYYIEAICENEFLECGETVTGTLSDGNGNIASFIFINEVSQKVTFSNCESTFDTQMRLIDYSSGSDITDESTNSCDGDDCQDSSVSCTTSTLRETFTMEPLSAGTYEIQLNPFSTGGTFYIESICDETTSSNSVDCCTNRCRKEWTTLSQTERDLFINGFKQLADNDVVQDMSQAHSDLFNSVIHWNALFLPWHRIFLYDLESKIRDLGGEYECFGLPYWDWTNEPTGIEVEQGATPEIFNSGLGNAATGSSCVSGTFGSGQYITALNDCLRRNVEYNSESSVCGTYTAASVMEDIDATSIYSQFRPDIERTPHYNPHVCIGANMAGGTSPDDPIFYLHHGMVDYIFALWQDCNDYDIGTTTSNSDRYNGGLTDTLPLPYNSNPNQYTVSDVYNLADLGVIYEKGPFWDNGNVDDEGNCGPDSNPDNVNDEWFYTDSTRRRTTRRRRLTESQDESERIYNELMESGEYDNRADLVHAWSVALCEWEQIENHGEICEIPDEFDDCSDMEINENTGDIDITLNEILSKQGVTDCMKQRRREYWDFASVANVKLSLCAGCFDPFCDKRPLQDKCRYLGGNDDNNYNQNGNIFSNLYTLNISTTNAAIWLIVILFVLNFICMMIWCWNRFKSDEIKYKIVNFDSEAVSDAN